VGLGEVIETIFKGIINYKVGRIHISRFGGNIEVLKLVYCGTGSEIRLYISDLKI
jgi:hypothetical protein